MIRRLQKADEHAVEELLVADPVVNLFLLGFSATHAIDRVWWYGATDGDRIRGAVLVLPGRVAVPWIPDPDDARALGLYLQQMHRPCMLVGPRAACDALWSAWAPEVRPKRRYDQRLYVLRAAPPGEPVEGFRRAVHREWQQIAINAAEMEAEDLGHNPAAEDPQLHAEVVQERVKSGRTWVIERGGEILFQINVGTTTPWGCQVGGTWVPPRHRGHGHATEGMRALSQYLLTRHPLITLHVNEANLPAVRVYEKVGFERGAPFRLITVRGVR